MGEVGFEGEGWVDAGRRYGCRRNDWEEGRSHGDGKEVRGFARRSRGWGINFADVESFGGCYGLSAGVTLRVGRFDIGVWSLWLADQVCN